MNAEHSEQPAVGAVEQGECPRNRWYREEGRQLRAAGWHLRKQGDKWNATHALIERRAAAAGCQSAPHERGTRSVQRMVGRHCVHRKPMRDLAKGGGWHDWIDERDVILLAVSGPWAMVRRPRAAPYVAPVKELTANND